MLSTHPSEKELSMNHFRPALLSVFLLSTLFLLAAPGLAQGSSGRAQHFNFDGGGIFSHPCGVELVECVGTTGVTVRNGTDANGIPFFHIHFQDHGIRCVGLDSGLVYRSAFTQSVIERNIGPFPDSCLESGCTATLTASWNLVSQGPAPNLKSHSLAQFTFTGQGEPILVNFTETTLSCD
jgi:hypothetical protein